MNLYRPKILIRLVHNMATKKWKQQELDLKKDDKPKQERTNYRQQFLSKLYKVDNATNVNQS